MCRKKPGIRCSGSVGKCLNDINEAVEVNKVRIDENLEALYAAETEEETEVLVAEKDRLETERESLKARKTEAQDDYDKTKRGRDELQDALADESLTPLERKRLELRYKKAVTAWEAQRNRRVRNAIDVANVSNLLREYGADEETIADITADITNDQGLLHPRAIKDYVEVQLPTAQARFDAIDGQVKDAVREAKEKALDKGLSPEQVEQELEKTKVKYAEKWKKAHTRLAQVRFAIDCHETGQESLRKQIADCGPEDFKTRAALKVRLMAAVKAHADGLSDRRNGERIKAKIKAVLKDAGKSDKQIKGIMEGVLGSSAPMAGEPKLYPHELRTNVRSHFAPADQGKVLDAFRRSREYKAGGAEAFNAYALRKVMADPRVGLTAGAVAEANAKAEIGFDSRPHRHFTTSAGARQARMDVHLTQGEMEIIKDRASSLQMSVSSYVNALMLGKSPFAIQNDRSKENWKKKRKAVNQMLAEMQAAA